jgi:hypothetical protein
MLAITQANIDANKEIFDEYMSYARAQTAIQNERADNYYALTEESTRDNMAFAQESRDRYRDMGIPLEDSYVRQLTSYDTPERRERRAGQAVADTATGTRQALESSRRELTRMGVNPGSVAGGSLDRNIRVADALAKAGAATGARDQSELRGIQLSGEAVNVRRGLPSMSAQATADGIGTGNSGLRNGLAAAGFGVGALGQGANMIGQRQDIASSGFNTANNIYGNDLRKHQMKMANSPVNTLLGMASLGLGTYVGAGGTFGINEGGYVTEHASPSRGAIPDDVPARLTAGEVVLTADTVRYHGLKTLAKLDKEAREALGGIPDA